MASAHVVEDRHSGPDDRFARHSDVELLIDIGRHRPAALREAYRRHGGAIHHLCARVCGPDQADAVTGGVMLELWYEPERFHPSVISMRDFLLARAHARAVEVARAGRQSGGPPLRAATTRRRHPPSVNRAHGLGPRDATILASLPDDERDAIALAYLEGYRYAEIAEALGQPELVIARRIRYGLRRLGHRQTNEEVPQ